MKPEIYTDLPMAEYLDAPAVSASIIKAIITRCPRAAWYESWLNPNRKRETSKEMDAGTIAHGILLEGSEADVQVIDPSDHPNAKGGGVATGWTNNSVRAARDAAIAAGKIPVLVDGMQEIRAMVAAAKSFIESLRLSEPAIWRAFQPGGGQSELTIIWDDAGTRCRIRPDRIATDHKLIVDYKTGGTSAEPDLWGRTQMVRMGYYTSAAFYRRGIESAFGETPDYVWLVQEQAAPYLCSLVGLDPHAAELGARKIEHGLSLWVVSDNLRKGAALNAVQIAECLVNRKLLRAA